MLWKRHRSNHVWYPTKVYVLYLWFLRYPQIQRLLAPYAKAQFNSSSKSCLESSVGRTIFLVAECLKTDGAGIAELTGGATHWRGKILYESYHSLLKFEVVASLRRFLKMHQEGGLVILAPLDSARCGHWSLFSLWDERTYPNLCMVDFPGIIGTEPIQVLRLVIKLNDFMLTQQTDFKNSFLNYLEHKVYFPSNWPWSGVSSRTRTTAELREAIASDDKDYFNRLGIDRLVTNTLEKREEARFLQRQIEDKQVQSLYPEAAEHWKRSDHLTRLYLLTRACDLAYYGESVANKSFPPTASSQDQALVSSLVCLLEQRVARLRQAALEKQDIQKRFEIEKKVSV